MNMNNHLAMGNVNKFRKLLVVAFFIAVLMLTSGVANAISSGGNIYYEPGPDDFLRVTGETQAYCDPEAGCYNAFAEVEMKLYENGVQVGHDYNYLSHPGGDNTTYTASITYDYANVNLSKSYMAVLEHWGATDTEGSYHDFTYLYYP